MGVISPSGLSLDAKSKLALDGKSQLALKMSLLKDGVLILVQ